MKNIQAGPFQTGSANDKSWHIASRWQEFEGELRAALVRVILILAFYSIQLGHYVSLSTIADQDKVYHRQITLVSAGWLFLSLAVWIALKSGFFPPILKYLSTSVDLLLVLLLAWLGKGPESPLVMALFVVVALASLRFQLGLIWYSTIVAMAGYMLLVGAVDKSWFDAEHTTPLLTQAITLCSLASTGVVLGQVIRSVKPLADSYALRCESSPGVGAAGDAV